ncbi:uncharacterized protein [Argopecten irradians]|uniref:uncharacterized protein n=1 Tax=Argopecten irradians TaxID=31199 RepID=UPI00371F5905
MSKSMDVTTEDMEKKVMRTWIGLWPLTLVEKELQNTVLYANLLMSSRVGSVKKTLMEKDSDLTRIPQEQQRVEESIHVQSMHARPNLELPVHESGDNDHDECVDFESTSTVHVQDDESLQIESEEESSDIEGQDSSDEELNAQCQARLYNKELYSNGIAVEKMYGDFSSITVLQWLAMQFHLFSSHPSMSKEMFTNNLKLNCFLNSHLNQRQLHPIPTTYKEARKMIQPYVLQKQVYFSCVNDCKIFKNENKSDQCQFCGSREKKRFIYLPIGPRLARYFGERNLAKLLHDHSRRQESIESDMWDLHDSPSWKQHYSADGYFNGSMNGISLAFEVDGVNPFHNVGVQYSMTPMMLTLLNLPREIRNSFENIMLVGIIPGSGRSEAGKLDPYINIMVDEMLELTECTLVDSYLDAPVQIKIKLLFYVMDYPGLSKVFNLQGSGGLSACHWCHVRGEYNGNLNKTIYPSNFLYLSSDDPLIKTDDENYGYQIKRSKPVDKDVILEESSRTAYENSKSKVNKTFIACATGCKQQYALARLPGHNRIEETQPDACHTVKDIIQNIVKLLTNKGLDIEKIEKAEVSAGRTIVDQQPTKRLNDVKGKSKHVQKVFKCVLTETEMKEADARACSIRTPLGFGVKPSPFITKNSSLKSHDWKQLACQGILKFCLRGFLSADCRQSLFYLLDVISLLCMEHQCIDHLSSLEEKVNHALALLERDFPLSIQNITTHILHHVVQSIRKFGPVYSTWMFCYERFNSWLCKRTLNMRHPESTAVETYIIFDWCQFMISSGKMPEGFSENIVRDMTYMYYDNEEEDICVNENDSSTLNGYRPNKKELKVISRVCDKCSNNEKNCDIRKKGQMTVTHIPTGRKVTYTSTTNQRTGAKTNSAYICFEVERGKREQKIESGKFLCFGKILYFISHKENLSTRKEIVFAVIQNYTPEYDMESGLWFCNTVGNKDKKVIFDLKDLSLPLVTAEENGALWFLNSNKKPFI